MSVLGKILLLLSTLCFLFTFGFKLALSGWMPFMSGGLGFAGAFLVFGIIIDFKFYKNLIHSESLKFVMQSLGFIGVTIVFLVALNYMGYKSNKLIDITENKVNSFSEFTEKVVKDVPSTFYFKYFHADSERVKSFKAIVRAKVAKYQELNQNIKFESFSIYKNPAEAKKFKVGDEESTLFAVFGDRVQRIADLSEATVTNAILRLTKEPKKIYFLYGHGEKQLNDETGYGLSRFKLEMERLHYELVSLGSLDIPKDAAFLAIIGPRMSFTDGELQKIRDYILSGGSLFLAIDPGESHQLANLTKSFGVEFQNTFVFDKSTQASQSDLLVFVNPSASGHDLSQIVGTNKRPLFFMASPLKVYASDFSKMNVTPVLSFPQTSVSRVGVEEKSGKVTEGSQIAALITEAKLKGDKYFRVFVVGDSDFLSNQFFGQHANFDFSLNVMSYLSKDEDMVKLRPRKAKTTYFIVSQTQLNIYFLFFVLPFIALFFIVALFLKLRRLF